MGSSPADEKQALLPATKKDVAKSLAVAYEQAEQQKASRPSVVSECFSGKSWTRAQVGHALCSFLVLTWMVFTNSKAVVDFDSQKNSFLYAILFLTLAFIRPAGAPGAKPAAPAPAAAAAVKKEGATKPDAVKQEDNKNGANPPAAADAKKDGDAKKDAVTAPAPAPVAAKKPAGPPRVRLLYLDNLKTLLTLFVVLLHVNIGFGAAGWMPYTIGVGNYKENFFSKFLSVFNYLNQAYFMALFFFVSGYFTPSSVTRKGVYDFLADKFKRFGIVLFFGAFVGFPLTTWYSMQAAWGTEYAGVSAPGGLHGVPGVSDETTPLLEPFPGFKLWYKVGTGPLWFLQVLLCLNIAFVLLFPKGLTDLPSGVPIPTFGDCLAIGSFLGLLQGVFIKEKFRFLEVPLQAMDGGGGLPFDVVFFFAGCIAKKNEWLEQLVDFNRERKEGVQQTLCTGEVVIVADAHGNKLNAPASKQLRLFRLHVLLVGIVPVLGFVCFSNFPGVGEKKYDDRGETRKGVVAPFHKCAAVTPGHHRMNQLALGVPAHKVRELTKPSSFEIRPFDYGLDAKAYTYVTGAFTKQGKSDAALHKKYEKALAEVAVGAPAFIAATQDWVSAMNAKVHEVEEREKKLSSFKPLGLGLTMGLGPMGRRISASSAGPAALTPEPAAAPDGIDIDSGVDSDVESKQVAALAMPAAVPALDDVQGALRRLNSFAALKAQLASDAKKQLDADLASNKMDAKTQQPVNSQFTGPKPRYPWQMVSDYLQVDEFNSVLWHVLRGQLTLTLSFVLVQLFSERANFELPTVAGVNLKSAASEAAYGVYVFHWLVWPAVLWFYLKFLDHPAGLTFGKCSDGTFASDTPWAEHGAATGSWRSYGNLRLFCGWLFVAVVSNLILWPGVLLLRKIPRVSEVL